MKNKFLRQYGYIHKRLTLRAFINKIYNSVKNRFLTDPTIFLNKNPKYKQWKIGDYTYGNGNGSPLIIYDGEDAKLQIGKFCSISYNVIIFVGGSHRVDWISTYPFSVIFNEAAHISGHPQTKGDIIIGNDVWIAEGATILSGVKIGNGAVVAAKSVVTKDVPAYTIVAGNPATPVKTRFTQDIIDQLQAISWWDWDIDKILKNIDLILSDDPMPFIEHFKYQTSYQP